MNEIYHENDLNRIKNFLKQTDPAVNKFNAKQLGLTTYDLNTLDDNQEWVKKIQCVIWNTKQPKQITQIQWEADWIYGKLDLTGCDKLQYLACYGNHLEQINVCNCHELHYLDCSTGCLTNIGLEGCNKLTILDCSYNQLTKIDTSSSEKLEYLQCNNNPITILKLGNPTLLTDLQLPQQLHNITLFVPQNEVDYCKNNQPWKKFGQIIEA